jgi:hypothetical protein
MPDYNLIFRFLLWIILISFVTHRAYYTRKYQAGAADDSPPEEPGPGR